MWDSITNLFHSLGNFIFNFQTLITGGLAVLAAWFAAAPVYRQVGHSNVQVAIVTREVLLARIAETEKRRLEASGLLGSITYSLYQRFWPDPDGDPDVHPEAAFSAEQLTTEVIGKLVRAQEQRVDTAPIEQARNAAINCAGKLAECLAAIHRPLSTNFDDPEMGLAAERVVEMEKSAEVDAKVAVGRLDGCIRALVDTGATLDRAFESALNLMRARVRAANNLILEGGFDRLPDT